MRIRFTLSGVCYNNIFQGSFVPENKLNCPFVCCLPTYPLAGLHGLDAITTGNESNCNRNSTGGMRKFGRSFLLQF